MYNHIFWFYKQLFYVGEFSANSFAFKPITALLNVIPDISTKSEMITLTPPQPGFCASIQRSLCFSKGAAHSDFKVPEKKNVFCTLRDCRQAISLFNLILKHHRDDFLK